MYRGADLEYLANLAKSMFCVITLDSPIGLPARFLFVAQNDLEIFSQEMRFNVEKQIWV